MRLLLSSVILSSLISQVAALPVCADGLATAVESIDDGSDVFNEEDMNNVDGFTDEIEASDDDTVQNYNNELELFK